MPENSEVLIGTQDGDHVLLRNWHYPSDDWTVADAELRCGPWQGVLKVWFYARELEMFADEVKTLYRELRGTATLHPVESYLKLTLTGNGRGGIAVEGYAQSDYVNDTKLYFQFSIDQTFLPRIADGLSHLPHKKPTILPSS